MKLARAKLSAPKKAAAPCSTCANAAPAVTMKQVTIVNAAQTKTN